MDIDLNNWYRCQIDKKEFKKLCKKSDWQGFKHMIIYFSALFFFGYLAYATWGTWWCILFFIIYGNIWGCADALWHETGHRTAFKSRFWNDFFYFIASFMDNFEPIRWRYSHHHHHSHTIFTDPLDFEIHVQKPTDLIMFFSWYLPFSGFIFFTKSLHWETLKHAFGVTTEVMRVCIPKSERSKCRWSARSHVFIWVATIVASIYFQSWLPLLFIVLPNFYGKNTFEWALLLPLAIPPYILAYTFTGLFDANGDANILIRYLFSLNNDFVFFPNVRNITGAIIVFSFTLYPYVYLVTRSAF